MNDTEKTLEEQRTGEHNRRDAETQTVLGIFISIMAIPVLIGTFWAERSHAMVVNVVAGSILLGIGILLAVMGRKASNKLHR